MLNHPIVEQSFQIIDREITEHNFTKSEYAIARRVIHSTADFDYLELLKFQHNAIAYSDLVKLCSVISRSII